MSGDNQYETDDPKFGKQDAIKGLKFQKLPPILQITLKRFDFDYQRMRLVKILDKYDYPEELNMFEFMDSTVQQECVSQEEYIYSLYAVLIHSGQQSGSGHYYAFIKKQNNWYKFNDTQVDIISAKQVQLGGEGGTIEYRKYNEKLKQIEEAYVTKKETAYMLVYVQKKQTTQILRDLQEDDIPLSIKQYYQEKKKQMEIDKRNKEFFKVKILCFQDLTQTNGNSVIFHQEYANSYISSENFDDIGKLIELKNLITLEDFIKRLSIQLKCDQSDILLFKVSYNRHSEKLVNLSQLIQKGMGRILLLELLKGQKIDYEYIEYCLIVLTNKVHIGHISLEGVQEEYIEEIEKLENQCSSPEQTQVRNKLFNIFQ